MKKTILLLVVFSPLWGLEGIYAQKELWGIWQNKTNNGYYGTIGKCDINGNNGVTVYDFTMGANGGFPLSKLFMASNGKLYGTTAAGGTTPPNVVGIGVLFEYDVVLNK